MSQLVTLAEVFGGGAVAMWVYSWVLRVNASGGF